jgi:hypothetical protein
VLVNRSAARRAVTGEAGHAFLNSGLQEKQEIFPCCIAKFCLYFRCIAANTRSVDATISGLSMKFKGNYYATAWWIRRNDFSSQTEKKQYCTLY